MLYYLKHRSLDLNHKILASLNKHKRIIAKIIIQISILLLVADYIYKSVYGISYDDKAGCIIYNNLPRWAFLIFEYFIEFTLIIIAGIFAAVILEKYFKRYKKLYPTNQVTAFLYASLLPVCSCSVIPILGLMHKKLKLRVLITFVVAAPLLNPYIIVLSFSVLGYKYALLRILLSFTMAIIIGLIVEFISKQDGKHEINPFFGCSINKSCAVSAKDNYEKTFSIFKKVFPYILIAAIFGFLIELSNPAGILKHIFLGNNSFSTLIIIILGLPVYFCNGADVIFLKPLVEYAGLLTGSALAFSITSTAICITSFIMLLKFIGKKNTIVMTAAIFIMTFIFCYIINYFGFL
ncbi:permease [Bacteroidota bacterium]